MEKNKKDPNAKYTSTSSKGAQSVNRKKRKNKKDIPHNV